MKGKESIENEGIKRKKKLRVVSPYIPSEMLTIESVKKTTTKLDFCFYLNLTSVCD